MDEANLAERIYERAISSGFDDCGIISLEDMDGYKTRLLERMDRIPQSRAFYERIAGIADIRTRFPWAKSLVICATWLGKYRYPESMRGKYAKSYFISPKSDRSCADYRRTASFAEWFGEAGIRCEGGEKYGHGQVGGLRYAAMMAGLGIIRKNNFLYNEKGSYLELDGYVIDRECRLYWEKKIRPCAEHCDICQTACPTGALMAPYAMNPLRCVSYCTTFGHGKVPEGMDERQFGQWLVGCDACQDCCPYNRHDWDVGADFPGLAGLVELLRPENLIAATDRELCAKVIPKTVEHIPPDDVETLRVNARRALRNAQKDTIQPPADEA